MATQIDRQKCYIMKLSPELRLNIYDALLEEAPKPVGVAMWEKADFCAYTCWYYRGTGDDAVALMKCC